MSGAATGPSGLAFKAREIEELADVYFFRPLGMVFAVAARALHLTPTAVTLIGTAVGVVGGALLAWPSRAFAGFLVIILHSILDSSDGQLARMTGQSSDFGRMMDGIGGYVTHIAIFVGIMASAIARGSGWGVVAVGLAAGVASAIHAQMYDYHRSTYMAIAINGEPTRATAGRPHRGLVGAYESMQRALAGRHPDVEHAVAARGADGRVRESDRSEYRARFYWPVRGWNLLGDNTRFYAIGVCAWVGRVELFFPFVLIAMNAALVGLWLWQAREDGRFLSTV